MNITTTVTLYRLNRQTGSYTATIDGHGAIAIPAGRRAPAKQVSIAICGTSGMSPTQYIARTEGWRPLDLHKDWLTWPGATTRGNNAR